MGVREEIVAMFLVLSVPTYECVGRGSNWVLRKAMGSLSTGARPRELDDAERWLRGSVDERREIARRLSFAAASAAELAPAAAKAARPRRRRDRAAYMRAFRRAHASPPRWARMTEQQKEGQRASVRRWRERQLAKRTEQVRS